MRPSLRTIVVVGLAVASVGPVFSARTEEQHLAAGTVADRIVVEKAARKLSLFRGEDLLKTYKIALGRNPKGHKEREGDGRHAHRNQAVNL